MREKKRILLVDDQSDFLSLMRYQFSDFFQVSIHCAGSGRQAIELLASAGEDFDLVISDYQMPDGDGKMIFQYLQGTARPLPFILYTSWLDVPSFEGENFLGVVMKADLKRLVELVQRVLNLSACHY